MVPRWLPVLLAYLLLLPSFADAQNALAARLYHWANREMMAKDFEGAIRIMRRAIKADPRDAKTYGALGSWFYDAHRFADAAGTYRQGWEKAAGGDSIFAKPLAQALFRSGDPSAAGSVLLKVPLRKRDAVWTNLSAAVRFAADALLKPLRDTAVPLGPRVNTTDAEMFPVAKPDGSLLLFTRKVGGMDEDFYRAVPDSCGGWLGAKALPAPPNTPAQEAAQALSADGHYLFFTRCDQRSESGWDGGGCDLYMAYTADGDRADSTLWSNPQPFGGTINSPAFEGMPCLSPDNRELFFASDRPGGYGGLDLWTTRFVDGLWQIPRNLGPEVNGAGDEAAPFLAADGVTLLFSSNGHAETFGGRDLYRIQRYSPGDTVWTDLKNLGASVNSGYDELSITTHPDGRAALFASDRGKQAGDYDLYSVNLPYGVAPEPATFVRGAAYDSVSRARLNYTRITLTTVATGERLQDFLSNRGDGSYTLVLKPHIYYAVLADRIGYTEVRDTLYYDGVHAARPAEWNVALLPADYEPSATDDAVVATANTSFPREEMVLRLHFEKNSVAVSDSLWDEIARAVEPLASDSSLSVVVNSYTDDSGTPLLNTQISELRARLVADVVERIGVSPGRIEARGWADAVPLAPNDSAENRRLNRRVEVVIRPRP